VALTFHGQGKPALAEAIVATAESARARVTVLAVDTWLDANSEITHRSWSEATIRGTMPSARGHVGDVRGGCYQEIDDRGGCRCRLGQ
jgi:hypothetical protein